MVHRSGAAQVRVHSQEQAATLGPDWRLLVTPAASLAQAQEAAPAVKRRGRPPLPKG
ncbi:hypothetical protein K0U83_11430 [bacterium]|nr:hypothetical protein [bacterium]